MGGPHGGVGAWGPPWGGPWGGGKDFFDKLKGCGGESLRRLFRLDFCIFEFFKIIFLLRRVALALVYKIASVAI